MITIKELSRNSDLIHSKILHYLPAVIVSNMSAWAFSSIDSLIVANLINGSALAAVSICSPMTQIMHAILAVIVVGVSVNLSILQGRQDENGANGIYSMSLILGAVAAVLFFLVQLVFQKQIIYHLTGGDAVADLALLYYRMIIFASPFMIINNIGAMLLTSLGFPKKIFTVTLITQVSNLVLDIFFIRVCHMSVDGAGLATLFSVILGSIYYICFLFSKDNHLKFCKSGRKELKLIFSTGAPKCIEGILNALEGVCIVWLILDLAGNTGIQLKAMYSTCLGLCYAIVGGCNDTMRPILGIFFAETDRKGVAIMLKKLFQVILFSTIIPATIMIFYPQFILNMFGWTGTMETGISGLRILAVSIPLTGVVSLMTSYYVGIDNKKIVMITTIMQCFVLFVPGSYILGYLIGINGVWMMYSIVEILVLIVIACMSKGNLQKMYMLGEDTSVMNLSMTPDMAAEVSEKAMNFLNKNGFEQKISYKVAMMIEEMAANYQSQNKKVHIDIRLIAHPDKVILSILDDGKSMEILKNEMPMDYKDYCLNLYVVQKVADRIKFSRIMGLNHITIELDR